MKSNTDDPLYSKTFLQFSARLYTVREQCSIRNLVVNAQHVRTVVWRQDAMKLHVTHIIGCKRLFQIMLSTKPEPKIYGAQGSEEVLLHKWKKA